MSPFVDHSIQSVRPAAARTRRPEAANPKGGIVLRVALATMPLIGLVTGVVGAALLTVH